MKPAEKIRRTAEEMGYQPNTLASSLKRSTQRIAILLPSDAGDNKYYYQPMWRGVHDYLSKLNANVECIELPYYESDKNEVFAKLKQLVMERRIDGILTVGHVDGFSAAQDWQDIHDRDISVVSINSENKLCDSLCCIQPEYDVIGRTMAELIIDRIPEFGSIFLCAGNPKWDAHSLIVKGFDDYLAENRALIWCIRTIPTPSTGRIILIFLTSLHGRTWRRAAASIPRARSCWDRPWRKAKRPERYMR